MINFSKYDIVVVKFPYFCFHHNLSDFTNYKLEFNYIKHPTFLKYLKL